MRAFIVSGVMSCVAVVGVASPAKAQGVSEFGVFKAQRFEQTAATASTTPVSYDCAMRFDTLTADSILGGTATWSGGTGGESPANLTFLSTGYAGATPIWEYWWPSAPYTSQAILDAHCPITSYQFDVSGGTMGTASGSMSVVASAYTTSTPAIDAPSFASLAAYNPSTTMTLSTVAHAEVGGTQFSGTWIDVNDIVANTTVASNYVAGGGVALSVQIDGGTLLPAHEYQVEVFFSDRVIVANAGFSASSESAFDRTTEMSFGTLLTDGGQPPSDSGASEGGTTGTDSGVADSGDDDAADAEPPPPGVGGADAAPVGTGGSSSGGTPPIDDDDAGAPANGSSGGGGGGGGGLCSITSVGGPSGAPLGILFATIAFAATAFVRRRGVRPTAARSPRRR
jgi:hypothetical protein